MIGLIRDKLTIVARFNDEFRLFAFFAIYLALWTLLAAYLPQSMEIDSTEQVVWSQSWQWGYYKHPPLPSALLHVFNVLFGGPSLGLIAFVAQGCSLVALFYVWLLAKQMLPKKLAITAVIITSLIAYHNFRALTFNHNTVSLPFTSAAWYYFYCCIRYPNKISNWLLLGFACGFAMLTKYSAVMILASIFVYIIWQRLWTKPIIRGLVHSAGVFIFLFSPNIVWLTENNWLPFTYLHDALTVSKKRFDVVPALFGNQLIRLSFMLPTLLGVRHLSKKGTINAIKYKAFVLPNDNDDLHYLLAIQFTPLILSVMPLLLTGWVVNSNWVSAFFLPSGILVTKCFLCRLEETQLLKSTCRFASITHAAILVIFFLGAVIYPSFIGKKDRSNFPNKALAKKITGIWYEHQQTPLAIIISDTWTGGNVLLQVRPEPTLLIDNDPQKSPWVNRHDLATCGAFVIFMKSETISNNYSHLYGQATSKGEFFLTWGKAPRGEAVQFIWAIKPPIPSEGPCRYTQLQDDS